MADKKSVIDIKIETANSAKSIGEMNKALKDLKGSLDNVASGSAEWKKLSKAINETEGRIGDINDSFNTLRGSGIERVQSSFGLLKQGLLSFDFGKIGIALKGLGAAFKAVLPFAIIEGFLYLKEHFDDLSKGSGILAQALRLVGVVIDKIGEGINWLTDKLNLTNTALDDMGEAIKSSADKAKDALEGQNAEYDRQIRVAKAAGKSTIALEKAKQQAIIDTNLAVARQIEAFVRAGGEFDEEKRKLLTASLEAIKGAKVTEFEIEQNYTKELKAEYKKRSDDKKKELDDLFNAALADQERDEALRTKKLEKEKADAQKLEEDRAKLRKQMQDQEFADQIAQNKLEEEELLNGDKRRAEAREKERQEKLNDANLQLQIASDVAKSIESLNDTVFAIKMAKVKKGSAEEEKLARRQFQINKALQLTLATIDGAKAITASLAAAPLFVGVSPNPAGIAGLAAAITNSALAITTIATKQYQPSGGGDTSLPSVSGNVGGGNVSAPNTQAPTTGSQPFTRLDESGRNQSLPTVKAYVVESEMTDKQKRVGRLESQASF